MKVKIKKLNDNAVIPVKAYKSDFCYDCIAISEEEIAPNVWQYSLGLAFEIVPETSIHSIQDYVFDIDGRPRSSIWKTGMILANCEATIDEGYRGEVKVVFYHVMPNMPRYKVGDRIIQIKLGKSEILDFVESDTLSETARGSGGFGSSGK